MTKLPQSRRRRPCTTTRQQEKANGRATDGKTVGFGLLECRIEADKEHSIVGRISKVRAMVLAGKTIGNHLQADRSKTGSMFPTRDERKRIDTEEIGPQSKTLEPMLFPDFDCLPE